MMNSSELVGCTEVYPTMAVGDLMQTVAFYRDQLGFDVEFTWGQPPVHAGVVFGGATLHFNQAKKPVQASEDFWLYFVVEDVDGYFEFLQSRQVDLIDSPTDREWGMREINVRDNNSTALRFGQWLPGSGDPVAIERVDVNARIEKRLAGLIQDLADHKGMTLGQMLEETLLHSFESVGDAKGGGMANPHTLRTIKHIEALKQQHGIDYDTHASYRFKEQEE